MFHVEHSVDRFDHVPRGTPGAQRMQCFTWNTAPDSSTQARGASHCFTWNATPYGWTQGRDAADCFTWNSSEARP